MEVQGTIKVIGQVETIKTFQKRELIITTEDKFPQTLCIEFTGDKTALLDRVQVGDFVKVNVNLNGREWLNPNSGKLVYFTTIRGWKIEGAAPIEEVSSSSFSPDREDTGLPF